MKKPTEETERKARESINELNYYNGVKTQNTTIVNISQQQAPQIERKENLFVPFQLNPNYKFNIPTLTHLILKKSYSKNEDKAQMYPSV